ncbi:MAG: hypothetical protein R3E02_13735 [Blastomonas sp.]
MKAAFTGLYHFIGRPVAMDMNFPHEALEQGHFVSREMRRLDIDVLLSLISGNALPMPGTHRRGRFGLSGDNGLGGHIGFFAGTMGANSARPALSASFDPDIAGFLARGAGPGQNNEDAVYQAASGYFKAGHLPGEKASTGERKGRLRSQ